MRFVPAALRPLIYQFGHTGAVLSVGIMAMAAAPLGTAVSVKPIETEAVPAVAPVQAVAKPAGLVTHKVAFQTPLKGYRVNSAFGLRRLSIEAKARQHKGVDMAAPTGTPVYATAPGRVVRAGYQAGGYGRFIEVKHPNGMTSLYAHLSKVNVVSGERVLAEQVIGRVGSTGFSTGPHLHFEIRQRGVQVNPAKMMGTEIEVKIDPDQLRHVKANQSVM
jgi:murein DD-endopeptidase MepM/ murein hydrolase activator NlpD